MLALNTQLQVLFVLLFTIQRKDGNFNSECLVKNI